MDEIARDTITIFSLALTAPTLMGCAGVFFLWRRSAWKAWQTQHKDEIHWFVLGVVIGFVGAFVDNIYWGAAWLSDYYNHPSKDFLFTNGVYSNLFFRQGCTVIAAYCHIRAAVDSSSMPFKVCVLVGWLAGLASGIYLFARGAIGA